MINEGKIKRGEFEDIFIQPIKEISCDEIDEERMIGDIEFPQFDKNGDEIFTLSANQACETCCISRNEAAVNKAAVKDLTSFILAQGALKDNTLNICLFLNLLTMTKLVEV